MQPLLAADGAGSAMRREMSGAEVSFEARETDLEHGYKELSIPAVGARRLSHGQRCAAYLAARQLHADRAAKRRRQLHRNVVSAETRGRSFAALRDAGGHRSSLLSRNFPDARALMPDCTRGIQGSSGRISGNGSRDPWHARGLAALIGDSAHAMVPFHGQGMNCCFEDCIEFDACVARHASWEAAFAEFGAARKPNTDAIAAMALENYMEMRESVADPKFQLQQALSLELERRFPRRFIPRYSMVMFHHEIPYLTALAARRYAGCHPGRIDRRLGRGAIRDRFRARRT